MTWIDNHWATILVMVLVLGFVELFALAILSSAA